MDRVLIAKADVVKVGRMGREMPMTLAESRQVEREEQRRWWDPRFAWRK